MTETKTKTETKTVVIEGTFYWAKLNEKNAQVDEETGKKTFVIDVVPSSETIQHLKSLNIPILNKDEKLIESGREPQGDFVQCKSRFQPLVVDSQLNNIDNTILIGNGSKGIVKANIYTYKPRKKQQTGVGLGLQVVQITELVAYNPLAGLEKTTGFTSTSTSDSITDSSSNDDDELAF